MTCTLVDTTLPVVVLSPHTSNNMVRQQSDINIFDPRNNLNIDNRDSNHSYTNNNNSSLIEHNSQPAISTTTINNTQRKIIVGYF